MTKVKITLKHRYAEPRYCVSRRVGFFFWTPVAWFSREDEALAFANKLKEFPKYV